MVLNNCLLHCKSIIVYIHQTTQHWLNSVFILTQTNELLNGKSIPANFFCDVGVRFLSWECWDFWKRHDHFRRFPKKSEVFRRRPKSAEGEVIEKTPIHKIRDREEGIVIYSFYTWFSFLTWVWVNTFLEIVSSKTATTYIFQSGVRNWPSSVSRREIEVFNPQAWELADILLHRLSKHQSQSTVVLFRTAFTRTIILNLLMKWLLGSNLSQYKINLGYFWEKLNITQFCCCCVLNCSL